MRSPLPQRRQCITSTVIWGEHEIEMSIGFYPDDAVPFAAGLPGELFADVKGQIGDTLRDAATIASIALQHGVSVAVLAKSMGRIPNIRFNPDDPNSDEPETLPASPVGAILDALKAEVAA